MTKISKFTTEDDIEAYNLELLDALGYGYTHGADLAPDDAASGDGGFRVKDTTGGAYLSLEKRQSFSEVLLKDRLTQAIGRINPHIPPDIRHQAQRELQNIASPDLINNNEIFHRYLTEGITVEYQPNDQAHRT
ncbi:MAG: type I restriction endonuclease [Kovacikia sp.]